MASQYGVEVQFSAKTRELDTAVNKLNGFERTATKLKGQNPFDGTERGARGASQAVDGLERKTKSAANALSGLPAIAGRVAAAFGGIALAQKAFQAGLSRIESERRLTALASAYGEVEQSQNAAARAAQKFGMSQTEANQSFSQIYARLRPIGTSLQDIETAYNGFNTAAKLAGTNASEASSAWLQLSQALGSGVLRGEELNSVFEQTPGIVQAIAKEMGAPIGQIRQLAQDGKITADIVIRALRRIETEGTDKLK
jgi:tape measure domain-containing protein